MRIDWAPNAQSGLSDLKYHYQTCMRGIVEIESDWTARERGWQLPEMMRDFQVGR